MIKAPEYQEKFAKRVVSTESSVIREVFKKLHDKNVISLAGGSPDTNLLPIELIPDITDTVIKKYGKKILQYGLTEGFEPLRQALVPLLTNKQIKVTWEDIFISSGAQGALDTIAMAFLDKGDKVAVESPTFLGAIKTFQAYQPQIISVKTDEFGIQPESLEQCAEENNIKFVYLVPNFQNPTGHTMSLVRRKDIIKVVKEQKLIVIEDDPYYELRYQGDDIPSLYSLAPENVIHIGSLSKIFSPGVRLGYFIGPKEICNVLVSLKQGVDLHASLYCQALATEYLASGYLEIHLKKTKKLYSSRLLAMLKTLEKNFPETFKWSKPEGGMFVWVEGPVNFDANKLQQQAMKSGVAFIPGRPFFVDDQGDNCFRLNFTNCNENRIEKAIEIVSKIVKETN